ncbi:MAG: hypothetical protein QOD82_2679, partial [Pseudonocardiales bacterium]|nr:hypothetical protein [Pseudonocardiales bacterium]
MRGCPVTELHTRQDSRAANLHRVQLGNGRRRAKFYGALSTHGETDPGALTIPLFARSVIYETKTVRGF